MSESMTVKQAMSFVSDVKSMLVFDSKPPCWKKALLVLADEVERLRNAEKSLAAFSGDVLGSADSVIQRLSEERDEMRRRVDTLIQEVAALNRVADNTDAHVRRIKAEAVREAIRSATSRYSRGVLVVEIRRLHEYANQIEGGA